MDNTKLIEKADTAAQVASNVAKGSIAGGGASAVAVWLADNAEVIGSIAGLVSIFGVIVSLIFSWYFNHKKLELQREQANGRN